MYNNVNKPLSLISCLYLFQQKRSLLTVEVNVELLLDRTQALLYLQQRNQYNFRVQQFLYLTM